jgi:hypothetical protein
MSARQTELRPWLHDTLDFMIERLEEARSPEHQLARFKRQQCDPAPPITTGLMSALPPIATAKADIGNQSCPLYPPKADMCSAIRDVSFGPKADIAIPQTVTVLC